MRFSLSCWVAVGALALVTAGCAKPEQKLGRGISNTFEVTRLGEMGRSVEQATIFEGADYGYTTGIIRGFNRTLARTGVGIYEIVTFPFPPYEPVFTNYLSAEPAYQDSYRPGIPSNPIFGTDTYLGYTGGDLAPMIPGSRFRVFDN